MSAFCFAMNKMEILKSILSFWVAIADDECRESSVFSESSGAGLERSSWSSIAVKIIKLIFSILLKKKNNFDTIMSSVNPSSLPKKKMTQHKKFMKQNKGIHKYWFFDMGEMTIFKTSYEIDLEDLEDYIKVYFEEPQIHSCGKLCFPVRHKKEIIDGTYNADYNDGEVELEIISEETLKWRKEMEDDCPEGYYTSWEEDCYKYLPCETIEDAPIEIGIVEQIVGSSRKDITKEYCESMGLPEIEGFSVGYIQKGGEK